MHDYRNSLAGLTLAATIFFTGCGGSGSYSSGGSGSNTGPTPTAISVTFAGTGQPLAAATQIGTGAWTAAKVTNKTLTVSVPYGTTNYAFAYVCPTWQGMGPVNEEFVIETTVQDGTAYNMTCYVALATGTATGSADASAIAGTANIDIRGMDGYGPNITGTSGTFSGSMVNGSNDVAAVAIDSNQFPLGVKIVRAQVVPGAIPAITLASSDAMATQMVTVTGSPSGFNVTPAVNAEYITGGGTSFNLDDNNSPTVYAVVPATEAQAGDYYSFETNNAGGTGQHVYAYETTPTAGAITLTYPPALPVAAPTATTFPTFSFTYSAFANIAFSSTTVEIQWPPSAGVDDALTVTATAKYLGGGGTSTITIPNLTAIPGFFATAPSGANIYWRAVVTGGTYAAWETAPASSSEQLAEDDGNYTEP